MSKQYSETKVADLVADYELTQKDRQLSDFFDDLCENPYELVFSFIKGSKKAKNRSGNLCYTYIGADSFWTSQLPTYFFDNLLSSDNFLLEDMLLAYFSHENNVNPDFVKLLAEKHPDKLIRFAKISQAFLKEKHWESFEFLNKLDNNKLFRFYKEAIYIRNLHKEFEQKKTKYYAVICQTSYEDLVIYLTKLIVVKPDKASNSHIFNEILTIKRNYHTSCSYDYHLTDKKCDLVKNYRKINNYKSTNGLEKILLEIVRFFETKYSFYKVIDTYACAYSDFKWENDFDVEQKLYPNRFYAAYERNKKKGIMMKWLFSNKALTHLNQTNTDPSIEKETLYKKQIYLEYFKYLNLDLSFEWYREELDLSILFDLLVSFSSYGVARHVYKTELVKQFNGVNPDKSQLDEFIKTKMYPLDNFQSQMGEGGDIMFFEQDTIIKFFENRYGKGKSYDKYLEFLTCERV